MVSRTGKYKALIIGALLCMITGMYLMTGLTATTPLPMLWAWMFITGLGIGPAFSVLTIVVQSVVPFERLGVATGNLTFFRQIGGSVGLAIVGTLFANGFSSQIPTQVAAAGLPPEALVAVGQHASSGDLTQVGRSIPSAILSLPDLQPWADQLIAAISQAFSLAIAGTFWLGVVMGIIALVAVVVALPEVTLRGMGAKAAVQPAPVAGAAGAGAGAASAIAE